MEMAHDFAATDAAIVDEERSSVEEPVFIHPERPVLRFRPLKALHHFRELIKNKEDTEQVFHIFQALPRRTYLDEARSFVESENGRNIRVREPYLPDSLDDHDLLRKMPKGSLAHAYCDFMEKEGLSAAGLVEEFDKFSPRKYGDLVEWYSNRQRDTHDLLHVLTGYGRDALGEQCVLAFTYGQSPALGHLFIAYGGGHNMKKQIKSDAPVFKAIWEAQKMGRACPAITDQEVMKLLAEPLDEIRERFHIKVPVYYNKAHACYRAQGIDPYDLLGELPEN